MDLIVTDHGDPSVGIFPVDYLVQCPFTGDETDVSETGFFKDQIEAVYRAYATGKVSSYFR